MTKQSLQHIENHGRLRIYSDFRDFLVIKKRGSIYKNFRKRYQSKRSSFKFLLHNDINYKKYKCTDTVGYVKPCHIIKGKEVQVQEFLNLKEAHTLKLKLKSPDAGETQELYLIYFINDLERHFVDLSNSLHQYFSNNKDAAIVHYHFEGGDPQKVALYSLPKINYWSWGDSLS